MNWTDERTERLKALWAEGYSASQIARQLGGLTRNAVIGKVHRLGLSGRTATTPKQARLVKPDIAASAKKDGGGAPAGRPRQARTRQAAPPEPTKRVANPQPEAKPNPAKPSLGLSIVTIRDGQCRYSTHTEGGDHRFCGHKTRPGSPYCEAHWQVTVDHAGVKRARSRKALDPRDRQKLADLRRAAGQTRAMG